MSLYFCETYSTLPVPVPICGQFPGIPETDTLLKEKELPAAALS